MKKMVIALLVVFGLAGLGQVAFGANPDAFEISCTPSIQYAVTISTPAAGLTFGTVDLNTSYVNSSTATVKNTGNVSADWKIKGVKLDTWDLGSAPGADTVRLLGVFKTSLASSGDFDVSLDTITATEANMNSTNYSVDANGDNVAVNGTRLLSIRLDTPTDSSVDVQQRFRVEIKAYASSTF